MRRLVVDGSDLEFDDKTAIGIDIQCLDIKEPGVRKLKTSNSFTVPATMVNKKILGIVGGVQSEMTRIYQPYSFTYYQGNERLINGAKLKIDSIGERISMSVVEEKELFEAFKDVKANALFQIIHNYLKDNNTVFDYPIIHFGDARTFQQMTESYANSTKGIHLSMTYGPLYDKPFENLEGTSIDDGPPYYAFIESEFGGIKLGYPRTTENEDGDTIIDLSVLPSVCPHFFIYASTFIEIIQSHFGIDIGVGAAFDANIWNDVNFKKILIPVPTLRLNNPNDNLDGFYYWDVAPPNADGTYSCFDPLTNVGLDNYSVYDIVMSLIKIMSATIDRVEDSYIIRRIDELETKGSILNWTGKIDATKERPMKPMIPNYAKKTYIKYEKIEEGVSALTGAKTVICSNQNLQEEADLFKIKAYVPTFGNFKGDVAPALSKANALTNPVFLVLSEKHSRPTIIKTYGRSSLTRTMFRALTYLDKASIYSLSGEYNFLDKINTSPKFYTVDLWLTNNDIRDLDNFTMVYLQELNGMFYVNKISGWNPDKSKSAVSVELIRISDRTPVPPADNPYFFDGQGNVFTDGQGNYFY